MNEENLGLGVIDVVVISVQTARIIKMVPFETITICIIRTRSISTKNPTV